MNYLIGMCQVEIRDYLGAHDAFNNAIRVDPKYSEVCIRVFFEYQREFSEQWNITMF